MQNEPNFPDEQMNINKVLTKVYENNSIWTLGQNEPNTNPIKPNQSQNKPNMNPKQTQNEPNQTRSEAEIPTGELLGILKPGTNPPPP